MKTLTTVSWPDLDYANQEDKTVESFFTVM